MATVSYTQGGNGAIAGIYAAGVYVIKRVVDIATVIASDATMTTNKKITSGDVLQVLNIPKNTLVLATRIAVITASTDATLTVGIGDADAATGFDATVDLTAATNAQTGTDASGVAAASGKLYTTADTIDVTFNNDATNGKFGVYALCVDMSDKDNDV
jgi:hypothetical protein